MNTHLKPHPRGEIRVFKAYLIVGFGSASFVSMCWLTACTPTDYPAPSAPPIEITRIPAPRYTAPTSTLPIMPTWTYGPGLDAVEVSQ
jgi:hypothetical protein